MATAIADEILEALQSSHWMNEVKLFIRGSNPMPIDQDHYPFIEVIVGAEQFDEGLTGGYSDRTYTGLLTFAEQITKSAAADWVTTSEALPRQTNVTSYDTVKRLIMIAQVLLGQEKYHNLDGLSTTWTLTHQTAVGPPAVNDTFAVSEVVTAFYLAGPIVYGVEERPNNYENSGSIAFVVETQRAPVVATVGA